VPAAGRKLVGVAPARALSAHRRLLRALETVLPVTFRALESSDVRTADGVLVLEDPHQVGLGALPDSCALLIAAAQGTQVVRSQAPIEFTAGAPVAYPLQERKLTEQSATEGLGEAGMARQLVLARAHGTPVWWCQRGAAWRHQTLYAPPELAAGETLRDHFKAGRFMGLTPLLHFLWQVCGTLESGPRSLRASFVIDDPNLHRPSYGHIHYRDLAQHAVEHGYHLGLATIPIDGWMTSRRAASLLRENEASLSLLLHGNEHTRRELAGLLGEEQAARVLGQALRRIARLEDRSGVRVRRVMAPPHGACSEIAARTMFRLGLEAMCVSRPYPWRDGMAPLSPADGWFPAEMAGGGLPVLPRYPITAPREELIFRALLKQPLILYGHHHDLADGLDTLAAAASDVNRLGTVTWSPIDAVARSNYTSRREGQLLLIGAHSRRLSVEVPHGVSRLQVSVPVMHCEPLWEGVSWDAGSAPMRRAGAGWVSPSLPVGGGSRVEVSFPGRQPLDAGRLESGRSGAWPILRRLLAESRDRALALANTQGA